MDGAPWGGILAEVLAAVYLAGVPLLAILGLAWLGRVELGSGLAGVGRGTLALWRLVGTGGGRWLGLGLGGVLALASIQARWDPDLTARLGRDWTPLVRALEGDLPAAMQALTPEPVLWLLAAMYLLGLPLCIALPLLWWGGSGRHRPAAGITLALLANYLLALPFYVFAPVSEPAWSGLSQALPALELFAAGLTPDLRFASALDNCFPSLHVSIAFTAWWFARRAGPPLLARILLVHWVALLWAVPALGVHWVTDTLFGLVFGALCAAASERALFAYEDRGEGLAT